jgi:threonine aldolase
MKDGYIDLRSDTVTKPTPRMREAMAKAEVGDDVYGEDPTINLLQETGAKLLGKEAGLFIPSGTMGNQVAVKCHTQPGNEVVVESSSHIYNYELGAMSALSGALPRVIQGSDGFIDPDQFKRSIRPDIYYLSKTTLLCLENTLNMAGGRCLPVDISEELCRIAKENGMKCHLDGARIFNAGYALKADPKVIARPFDSVMFCFSKGLCAPVGSLLLGSGEFIEKARKYRKMFGGGMRQAGVLAAACIVALDEVLPKLEDDHNKAKKLAFTFSQNHLFEVHLASVETNIFMVKVRPPDGAEEIAGRLKENNILVSAIARDTIRVVTHQDISYDAVETASSVIEKLGR